MALRTRWLTLGVLLLFVGCEAAPASQPTPTATLAAAAASPRPTAFAAPTREIGTATAFPPTATPFPPPDEAALEQATIVLPETGAITLQDGGYAREGVQVALLAWRTGWLAFNGGMDAVAAVSLNTGGSGHFIYLVALYNEGGRLTQRENAAFLGDRIQVEDLSIWEGRLVVEAVVHWADEPLCCPTKRVRQTYRNVDGAWRLEGVATHFPEGVTHTISLLRVGAPDPGSVQVYGIVSVMPFENTLTYRWLAVETRELLGQGALMTTPDNLEEMGGPGHFEASIPLPDVPSGQRVELQILELSMRDGSVIAQQSAWVQLP